MTPLRIIYACRTLGVPDHDRCNAMANNEHDVLCLVWPQNKDYIWQLPSQTSFRTVQIDVDKQGPRFYLAALIRLCRAAFHFRPNVLIIYGFHDPALLLLAAFARLRGIVVLSINDSKFDDFDRSLLREIGKSLTLMPYHGIIAASQRAGDYVKFMGKRRTALYYCAIDVDRVAELAELSFQQAAYDDRYFIMIARFVPKKNHLFMLDAFEYWLQNTPTPRKMRLVGYGDLEEKIRAKIASSPLLAEYVVVEGYKGAEEISTLLGGSLALVLPSLEEQFGIVVTEAFASGIPVIASPVCGAADIIRAFVNGHVVDLGNVEGWAAALEHISQSEEGWRVMSTQARRSARKAHVSVFVDCVNRLTLQAGGVKQ